MTILALDISTKTGVAVFEGNSLISYDTLFPEKSISDCGPYPVSYVLFAEYTANRIFDLVKGLSPYCVVIEETNKGKNPYSQKILEFIHFAVISRIHSLKVPMFYIRTGVWRGIVGANLNADEKKLNAQISKIKRQTKSKLAKIDGKVIGKRTKKHAALRAVQEHYGISLQRKMEDAAEAILLGRAYLHGASHCDGSMFGGTGKEES